MAFFMKLAVGSATFAGLRFSRGLQALRGEGIDHWFSFEGPTAPDALKTALEKGREFVIAEGAPGKGAAPQQPQIE